MKQNVLVKTIALLLFSFLLSVFSFYHCLAQDCVKPTGMDYLDGNNIKALIKNDGTHFQNSSTHLAEFEVPKNSGKKSIYASAVWIGGWSLPEYQGTLHLAAMRFGQNGNDFWAGPVSNGGAEACKYYDHTWKVTKEEIDYHKVHYADADYVMPWVIANWPAHGRAEYGESANLAPYKNVAGNASYEPALGDYPFIRGDQAVYFIINDVSCPHGETQGTPLGVEISGMAYAYDSPDLALQNCIFLSYELRNKSEQDYYDSHFGFWIDFDLGYALDDYVGCDTLLNLSYGYNGTEVDGNGEVEAYGENPPAQGAMFLNQKMSAFVYYNNSGNPVNGEPRRDIPSDYYNYLTAKWLNGAHITYGGTGTDPESTPTNYMYSGDPVTETGWTESTAGNAPGDRRGVMIVGPFTFSEGKTITVDVALPWARDYSRSNLSSITLLKQLAQDIQKFYEENIVDIKENTIYDNKLLIYPNPSNGQFTITGENIIESIELYDILGKKVFADTPKMQTSQINVRLPQGLYLYRIMLQDNSVSSGKILVQ
jgi:hypothetical protein